MGEVEAAKPLTPSPPPATLGTPGRGHRAAGGAGGVGRRWSHGRQQIQPSWGIRPHLARFTPEKQRRLPAPLSGREGWEGGLPSALWETWVEGRSGIWALIPTLAPLPPCDPQGGDLTSLDEGKSIPGVKQRGQAVVSGWGVAGSPRSPGSLQLPFPGSLPGPQWGSPP